MLEEERKKPIEARREESQFLIANHACASGNAAAMRVALAKILGIADHLQTRYALPKLVAEEILELIQIAESALAAPPRNCDKFSHYDALNVWAAENEKERNGCFDEWLYHTVQEGESDGSK